jgi:hypothetical protein
LFEFQATQAFALDNVWLPNDFDNAVGNLSVYWGFYNGPGVNNYGQARFVGTAKLAAHSMWMIPVSYSRSMLMATSLNM